MILWRVLAKNRPFFYPLTILSEQVAFVPPHHSQFLPPKKETSDLTSKEQLTYLFQWTHLEFFRDITKLRLTYLSSFSEILTTHLDHFHDPQLDHHAS